MDAVWAQERLQEDDGTIKADALARLTYLATGDLEAAERAWGRRARAEQARNDYSATGSWLAQRKKARGE